MVENGDLERGRFFRPGLSYFGLWLALWLILGAKLLLIRGAGAADFLGWFVFGPLMLVSAYFGALLVWRLSERRRLAGEIAFLSILAVFFIVRTVFLYREALAAGN